MRYENILEFIHIPMLCTERLLLRRITKKDLSDVYEYSRDPLVSKYLLWTPHNSVGVTRKYLSVIDKQYKHAEFYTWGVEYKGRIIGTAGFNSFSLANNSAEVGYVLGSKYWGFGIATEALGRILQYGFEHLKLNRIEIKYMSENTASLAVAKKCGFTYEGTKREAIFSKGAYVDIGIAAITARDYRRLKNIKS